MADQMEISINNLISYIKDNQIAYQYCNELVGFTKEKDSEVQPQQIVNDIIGRHCYIIDSNICEEREGYEDLCTWSIPSDVLIKVDSGLLICIPYENCLTSGILKD